MSIRFERQNNELILEFSPELISTSEILDVIEKGDDWQILHCFSISKRHFRKEIQDENELHFCIGKVYSNYTQIDSDVIGTNHVFFFANDIKLDRRHFVAFRNISILSKIDDVVEEDVYIGGNRPEGCLPMETFESLIKKFPKTAELNYYARARIASIIKEYYPLAERHEQNYYKYLDCIEKALSANATFMLKTAYEKNAATELKQFNDIRSDLNTLLNYATGMSEQVWQEQIHGILRLIYPKYIAGIREVAIKGVDKHDKRPDFLLVDANGYIDVLEIKKPDVQLLTKQSSYRNNYVPVRELAGAILQIEKYIYCLNAWGSVGETELQKRLISKLPASVTPKVVNPQGILLLGRSDAFNQQQKDDFELIKRQYKHIADIMTYDDLLQRLDNIIAALSQKVSKE